MSGGLGHRAGALAWLVWFCFRTAGQPAGLSLASRVCVRAAASWQEGASRAGGAVSITGQTGAGAGGGPSPSGLADVIDTILDKGLVIDAYIRVSLVGIELVTIDARIVIASVDTYLRFAEAVNRLDISQDKAGIAAPGGPPSRD